MQFSRFVCAIVALAEMPTGGSAGMVAKRVGAYGCQLSKGQAERVLKTLESEGYVISEHVAYRPGIDKVLYHIAKPMRVAAESMHAQIQMMDRQLEFAESGRI